MGNHPSNEELPEDLQKFYQEHQQPQQYYQHSNPHRPQHQERQLSPSTSSSLSSFQRQHHHVESQHHHRDSERERGRDGGRDRDEREEYKQFATTFHHQQHQYHQQQHRHQQQQHQRLSPSPPRHGHQLRFAHPVDDSHLGDRDRHSHDPTSFSSVEGSGGTSTGDGRRRRPNTHHSQRRMGPYIILESLGSGGSAKVKLAMLHETGEEVALKLIKHSDIFHKKAFGKQVGTELEILRYLNHPNIIRLYHWELNAFYPRSSSGEQVPVVMLVMELAKSRTLADFLAYTGPVFQELYARRFFLQILDALQYCHSINVYHRDLKPENLLLDERFVIKVGDFGLAKLFNHDGRLNVLHTNCGTEGYRAPEVLQGSVRLLDKADMWSAGAVLFKLVVGWVPFTTFADDDQRWQEVFAGNWEKFWKYWEDFTNIQFTYEFKHLAAALLQPNPNGRPQAAQCHLHPWFKHVVPGQVVIMHEMERRLANMRRNYPVDREEEEDYSSSDSSDYHVRALPKQQASVFLIPPGAESLPFSVRRRGDSAGNSDNKMLRQKFTQHLNQHGDEVKEGDGVENEHKNDNHDDGHGDRQKPPRPPSLSPGYPLGLTSILTTQDPEEVIETIETTLNGISNHNYSYHGPWKFRATFTTNLGTTDLSISLLSVEEGTYAILFTRRSGPEAAYRSAFAELFYRLSLVITPPPPPPAANLYEADQY